MIPSRVPGQRDRDGPPCGLLRGPCEGLAPVETGQLLSASSPPLRNAADSGRCASIFIRVITVFIVGHRQAHAGNRYGGEAHIMETART